MLPEQITLPDGFTIRDTFGGRYAIQGLLGKGQASVVYLVRDLRVKQHLFALKEIINPNQQELERFMFEAEVLKRLAHRALPRVYRIFAHSKLKRGYILMDYIKGKNLETLRREQPEQRFSLPLTLALMHPVVDALMYLHHQEPPIVHRDIKPENIIVPIGGDEAVLVDFGSAKEYVANEATTLIQHRSPGYAAPEQYGSGTTPRTDIYGLGATLYTLLTGTIPPNAITRVTRSKSKGANDPLSPAKLLVPAIPTTVDHALQRAMSISSADRFETVEQFWQLLNVYATEQQVQLPRVTSEDAPQPLPKRDIEQPIFSRIRGVLLPILLILLGIIVLGTGFIVHAWELSFLLLLCLGTLLLVLFSLLSRR